MSLFIKKLIHSAIFNSCLFALLFIGIQNSSNKSKVKFLKDFPEWGFLPQNDLDRKTIEIFFDLNLAKKSCNREQKVLKVPNTDVFKIASPLLIAKGISRIVCAENIIAL